MPQVTSTRWCPTPEQLMILEDIYRSGFRTPNASQIQKITAHLACYGRIEGKNVFYWFQNHKARERQKLRRRLFTRVQHHHHHQLLCSGQPHLFPLLPHPTAADVVHGAIPFHHFPHQDSTRGQNLLREIEGGSGRDEEKLSEASSTNIRSAYLCQWMAMMDASGSSTTINPPCCRPLQTLDLFPTRSTGLKDECNSSKSSSSALVQIL